MSHKSDLVYLSKFEGLNMYGTFLDRFSRLRSKLFQSQSDSAPCRLFFWTKSCYECLMCSELHRCACQQDMNCEGSFNTNKSLLDC